MYYVVNNEESFCLEVRDEETHQLVYSIPISLNTGELQKRWAKCEAEIKRLEAGGEIRPEYLPKPVSPNPFVSFFRWVFAGD